MRVLFIPDRFYNKSFSYASILVAYHHPQTPPPAQHMKRYGRRTMGRRRYGRKLRVKPRRTVRRRAVYRRRSAIPRTLTLGPGNLPLGQRCRAKLVFNRQDVLLGTGATPWVNSLEFTANGLNFPATDGTIDNRASTFLNRQFRNYRVTAMKYTLTVTQHEVGSPPEACYIFMIPYVFTPQDNQPVTTDFGQLGAMVQYPGFRYKMISHRFARTYTKLKGTIVPTKMFGRPTKGDVDFQGSASRVGPNYAWSPPVNEIRYRIGAATIDESALANNERFVFQLRTTYYVEFFNPNAGGVDT